MAKDLFFTGFEGSEVGATLLSSTNVVFVDDGTARTGQFHLQANVPSATTNDGKANGPTPAAGISITSGYATGNESIWFQLLALPSGDGVILFGYGTVGGAFQGTLRIKGNGTFAASYLTTIGNYSTPALAINTWYKAVLNQVITCPSGSNPSDSDIAVSVSVYNASLTLIATVTATGVAAIGSSSVTFAPPLLGHADAISSTYLAKFDDWISVIEDNGPATLPTCDRITRVDATGIAGNTNGYSYGTNWGGDYRSVIKVPFQTAVTDEMSSMDLGTTLTFNHLSASALGVTGVQALKFYYQLKAASAGNEFLQINLDQFNIAIGTTYGADSTFYTWWNPISDLDFTNLVFGISNQRSLLIHLGQMFVEALHAGSQYWPNNPGVGSWSHKVVTYTGNGGHQSITGIGFKPQLVLIKKASGADSSGLFKISYMGGTRSKPNNSITPQGIGIMSLDADGFSLGPSADGNDSGASYVALCIQDGGFGINCFYLRLGAYVGNGIDDRYITIPNYNANESDGFSSIVGVSGSILAYSDNSFNIPDDSVPFDTSADISNLIQIIDYPNTTAPTAFQVGSSAKINTSSDMYYYFVITNYAANTLNLGFWYDGYTGASPVVVPPFGFEPFFVFIKTEGDTNDAQWRCRAIHSDPNSSLWAGTSTNTTGITALPSGNNGCTLGSTVVEFGKRSRFMAFASSLTVIASDTTASCDAGIDQSIASGTLATLAGSTDEGTCDCDPSLADPIYVTSLWTKVSGPGTVTFSDNTSLTPTASFSAPGVYVLELTITGTALGEVSSDTVQITVSCPSVTVSAGSNESVLLPTGTVALAGTATGETSVLWTQLSGPSTSVFDTPDALTTNATYSAAGEYVFQLAASNSCQTVTSQVTITVIPYCALPSASPYPDL